MARLGDPIDFDEERRRRRPLFDDGFGSLRDDLADHLLDEYELRTFLAKLGLKQPAEQPTMMIMVTTLEGPLPCGCCSLVTEIISNI